MVSIFSQEAQYKVIRTNHLHKSALQQYVARYTAGEDILDLAASVDFPPCLLLRRVLECVLGAGRKTGELLRCPAALRRCAIAIGETSVTRLFHAIAGGLIPGGFHVEARPQPTLQTSTQQ